MCAFKQTNTYRHYDPYSQTFLSEDPIGFAGRDENLYRYVKSNPVLFRDPYGKKSPLAGALSLLSCGVGAYKIFDMVKEKQATDKCVYYKQGTQATCSQMARDNYMLENLYYVNFTELEDPKSGDKDKNKSGEAE